MLPLLQSEDSPFPPVEMALDDPNGLLAVGGGLSSQRLLTAYKQGIFPWYEAEQPVLWWSPDPRIGMQPQHVRISASMAKFIRKTSLRVTLNHDFEQVINACAAQRIDNTWISDDMISAYCKLHQLGHAHSVEVWNEEQLVGGLYGVSCGAIFCGESMFHRQSNASKLAFIKFSQHFFTSGGQYIDGQIENPHLLSLGMQPITRAAFSKLLKQWNTHSAEHHCWQVQELI